MTTFRYSHDPGGKTLIPVLARDALDQLNAEARANSARASGEGLKGHRSITGSNEPVRSSDAANLGDLSFLHGLLDLPALSFSESACAFPPSDIEWL
jgi:hypothetical protein